MPDKFTKWQAPDRDSPEIQLMSLREELNLLLRLGEANGDDDVYRRLSEELPDRSRRWRKIFERMGLVFHVEGATHITGLGSVLLKISRLNTELVERSLDTLAKYQLKNPADDPDDEYPADCDIHPYWAIWKAATELDGKLHWDELNRVLMHVFRHADLDAAIDKIRVARGQPGYDPIKNGTDSSPLGERCYPASEEGGKAAEGQVRDQRTTPWFKRAGLCELLLKSPGTKGAGYWTIIGEHSQAVRDIVSKNPPSYISFTSRKAWFKYFGSLVSQGKSLRFVPTTAMQRLPNTMDAEVVRNEVEKLGGHYEPELFARYHSALNFLERKHFVILTGTSGTGKTHLAKQYARAVHGLGRGIDRDPLFFLCPVRPDWVDPSGLLGYMDVLTQKYIVPPFLDALLAAKDHPSSPIFVCLDEMNIARVEYYFAEILSSMESGVEINVHSFGDDVVGSTGVDVPNSLPWPANLYITGTVNIDETTHPLSDKVLDRAVVIDMSEVDMGGYLDWLAETQESLAPSVAACKPVLVALHGTLEPENAGFGYRTAREFVEYHSYVTANGGDAASQKAIDEQIMQKVLIRLRGTDSQRKMLEELATKVVPYPKSAAQVKEMMRQLEETNAFKANR